MFKVFYIEDENGKYISEDGSKRWTRLTGQALYNFLQTEKGKNTYFFVDTDNNGVAIGVEISDAKLSAKLKSDKNRSDYLRHIREDLGYTTVSFDYFGTEEGTSSGDEVIPNNDDSIEEELFRRIDFETLKRAIDSLTEDECALISALYLQDKPMTLHQYASQIGVHFTTVDYRRKCVLKKLKSFFKFLS